jgi:predicted HicB family RNase H-like nuclease
MGKNKRQRTKAELEADSKRSGRPPINPRERHSARITINVTPEEKNRIESLAANEGISLSEMIMRPWRNKEAD